MIRHICHIMKIAKQLSDEQILTEMGHRLAQMRLDQNLTQAELAHQAGVSKRTVERFEAGESLQLSNLIRLCRVLNLLDGVDAFIPAPKPSPMMQLKMRGKVRQRASSRKMVDQAAAKQWTWRDKA